MTSQYVNYDEYRAGFNPAFLERARKLEKEREKERLRLELKAELDRAHAEDLRKQAERWKELQEMAERLQVTILERSQYMGACDVVIAKACRVFGVTPSELKGKSRAHYIATARQFCFYWIGRRTNLSLPNIGRRFGGRDHTTILHGLSAYPAKRGKMGRRLPASRNGVQPHGRVQSRMNEET